MRAEADWTFVENAVTGVQGYVPPAFIAPNLTLEAEPWFFGKISRAKVRFYHLLPVSSFIRFLQAEKLLSNPMRKHGCFLIRESEVCSLSFSFHEIFALGAT